MFRNIFRGIKNEKGQAVVELAITLPILLIILCGIIDFGWLFTNQNVFDHCAREGARYAIVHSADTVTSIQTYTKSVAPSNLINSLTVDVTYSNPSNKRAGDVTIQVNGDVDVLTPIVGVFTQGQKVNLSSSCTMKVE